MIVVKKIKTEEKWDNYKKESFNYLNNVQSILDKAALCSRGS